MTITTDPSPTITLDLMPGDRVTISATHKVYIDGMDAYIKLEVNSQVQEGENSETSIKRVGKIIARNVTTEIERQGEVIAEANAAQARK